MDPRNLLVSRSLVDGQIAITKFGRNPDVDAGTEDVWSQGGTWVAPTTARLHNLTSSSANDAAAGSGARTVTVNGLNGDYTDTTETVTLNGTNAVSTVNSYVIVHRMIVATAGSGGTNAGTILATAATDSTVTTAIVIGKGQSQLGIYQVPAGYTGYVYKYGGSMNGGAGANVDLELFAKPLGGVFNLKSTINLAETGSGYADREFTFPNAFAAKTTLKLTATSDAANSNVVGFFDLLLIED